MIVQLLIGAATGGALALAFLGGLWLTAQRVTSGSRGSLMLVVVSGIARVALIAGAFVALTRFAGPAALAAGFITFISIRTLAVSWMKASFETHEA